MSDRPAPKFQVGEEVIVAPVDSQPWSAIVMRRDLSDGARSRWVYQCTPDGARWAESVLRKRPQLSTQSFTELLQSTQQPNKVKA